ncbi:MAG: hypothetical protein U1E56_03465 [Bauldia sp.]
MRPEEKAAQGRERAKGSAGAADASGKAVPSAAVNPSFGSRLSAKRRHLLRGADFREGFLLGLSALAVKALQPTRWAAAGDRMRWLSRGAGSGRYRRFGERVRAFYGPAVDGAFVRDLWRDHVISLHRRRLMTVAEHLAPDHRAAIRVEGLDNIRSALAAGRGAILWFDNLRHHSLIGRRGIAEAGFQFWCTSAITHGFSSSLVGARLLNPIQVGAESRYCQRRVVFDESSALTATREIREHLAANGIVCVTNNAYIGRRVIHVPIGAAAWLAIATTPLNIAYRDGATLLPVATLEHEPFRSYSVTVGAPLPVRGPNRDRAFRDCARHYAAYLEPIVRAHPGQWIMWQGPIDRVPAASGALPG